MSLWTVAAMALGAGAGFYAWMRLIIGENHWFLTFVSTLFGIATFVMFGAHRDDARFEAECRARGGMPVQARSPMIVCVKPQ